MKFSLGTLIRQAIYVAVGVIFAGVLLKYGYENDVPVLKDAAQGFDQ